MSADASPVSEFCDEAVMRTSTMSPFCALLSWKCTDWRYGERPCFWPGMRPLPVTSTGKVRPWGCNYHLDVDDLNEFAAFLEDCGGFAIN